MFCVLIKHEKASVEMFQHMVETNNLREDMKVYGLNPDEDLLFIIELIQGVNTSDTQVHSSVDFHHDVCSSVMLNVF